MADEQRAAPQRPLGKVIKSDPGDASMSDKVADRLSERAPARPERRAGVVNAEEFEAKSAAKQIVEAAEQKRQEIIDDANRQRDEVFAKAVADAQAEVAAKATEELARAKMQAGQMLQAAEGQLIELALSIASKIVGRDLQRDPELVAEIAATAIENARAAKAMVLRVNPKDGALLREKRPKLMELIGRTVELAIRDDSDVEVGGCIIQTEFGTIDAQLKTQFEMLRNVLYPDAAKKGEK